MAAAETLVAPLPDRDADIPAACGQAMVHGRAHFNRDAAMTRRDKPISAIVPGAAGMGLRSRFNDAWIIAHDCWKGRIFFAFADQGLFSTTNFVLTILYATWLPLKASADMSWFGLSRFLSKRFKYL